MAFTFVIIIKRIIVRSDNLRKWQYMSQYIEADLLSQNFNWAHKNKFVICPIISSKLNDTFAQTSEHLVVDAR